MHLLGGPYVFGTPTSILYRSDLVRAQDAFYPNPSAEADTSACFQCLRGSDFGFVHQVLSYERVHEVRVTTTSQDRNAYLSSNLSDLLTYGPCFMTDAEVEKRLQELLRQYYDYLAVGFVNARNRDFWRYHRTRLKELGHPLQSPRLGLAIGWKLMDLLLNPKRTAEILLRRAR
jgi:hypothetical protein